MKKLDPNGDLIYELDCDQIIKLYIHYVQK